MQLTFLLIEFVPILGESLAVLFERGLQPLVISALLIHAGAGFGQLCGFLLQFLHARGQLFRLFVESGVELFQGGLLGGRAPLRARPRDAAPASTACRCCSNAATAAACSALRQSSPARIWSTSASRCSSSLARVSSRSVCCSRSALRRSSSCCCSANWRSRPARFLAALVELLHALSQFLEQDFLPPTGCRLPLFPLPLPLVELLPPLREFAGLLLQFVGLTRQVEIAAFDVRDVLLQLVRHLPELFGQRPLNLLDPVTLRLQQLLRALTLLFERAGELHAPLGRLRQRWGGGLPCRFSSGTARQREIDSINARAATSVEGPTAAAALLRVTCYHCYRSEPWLGQKRTIPRHAVRSDRDESRPFDGGAETGSARARADLATGRVTVIMDAKAADRPNGPTGPRAARS